MDTKERVKGLFKGHCEIKQNLGIRRFQISHFSGLGDDEVIAALTFSRPEGEYIQNSNITDKSGRIALMYKTIVDSEGMEILKEMVKTYQTLKRELDVFEHCITLLEPKLSEIITDMVIKKMAWNEIQTKYNISRTTLVRYRKKAVVDIAKMLEYGTVDL